MKTITVEVPVELVDHPEIVKAAQTCHLTPEKYIAELVSVRASELRQTRIDKQERA